MATLDEFVKPRPRQCRSCIIAATRPDLWSQVIAGRNRLDPYSYVEIASWLTGEGVPLSYSALRDHFAFHHESLR